MFQELGKAEELTIIFRQNSNVILRQWDNRGRPNRIELTREQRALAARLLRDYRKGEFVVVERSLGASEGARVRDALLLLDANGHVLISQADCLGEENVVADSVEMMADWASDDPPSIWDLVEQSR